MTASYNVVFLLFLSLEGFREIWSARISLTVIAGKQDNTNRSYYRKPVKVRFRVRKKKKKTVAVPRTDRHNLHIKIDCLISILGEYCTERWNTPSYIHPVSSLY